MTVQELHAVRELKVKIKDIEKSLRTLRISADNLVPIIDGLPCAIEAKSRVEKIALMIVDRERELETLRNQLVSVKSTLANKIMSAFDEPTVQTLLILRYIECLTFKDIARRMCFCLRYVFKLHNKAILK